MGVVFINYRGTDSYSYGALLHAELSRHFGPDLVFLDSESIPAGADFVEQILGRVRRARVVLAVIGTHWLTATGPGGKRLLDDPADWIRRELVEAFAAGVRVIPVLTDGADMPTEADLPADLALLARCQYRRLRHRDASADLDRLVGDLTTTDEDLGAVAFTGPLRGVAGTGLLSGSRPEPAAFLVRVLAASGQVVGLGALVGKREILTCAHVVNAALNRDRRAQERPGDDLAVDFPLLSDRMAGRARVVQWLPPPRKGVAGDDIAG